jgi:hypothetical protein
MATILKTYSNKNGSFKINVLENISYQIVENGEVVRTAELDHKYDYAASVIRHIEGDIKNGYYPKLSLAGN